MRAGRVLVLGSYNHDHVWVTDQLPAPGATRFGAYHGGPGGKGFNQAVAAARAGAEVVFLTALGDDAAAVGARALAMADGIDLRDEVHPDCATGAAGIFVDADGRNMILVAPGANAALRAAFVDAHAEAVSRSAVVLAQLETADAAVLRVLALGRAAGARTVLNPAPANAATTPALLAVADVLTPHETEFAAMQARHGGPTVEAEAVHALPDADLHALCQRLCATTWVVTLGAAGAFVSHARATHGDAQAHYRVPAAPARPVDTTGAGDAFNGALAAALARAPEAPFDVAVRFAARYAARSTERPGAALSMPHLAELGD